MELPGMTATGGPRVHTVTEVTRAVREVIEGVIGEIWVEGEICNHRKQASGHQYFTLKDDRCQLPCVLFYRPGLRHAAPPLSNGMQVHVRGNMTVYEARGQYQMNVGLVMAAGAGLLAAKFEALKRKLEGEGLFDPARKRPLPRFPKTIGIVTSPSGAAIRDLLNILERRAPWIRVLIAPVRVQGSGAAAEIAAAIRAFENEPALREVEVIIIGRGGGSAEDLWEFNEEELARAIAASPIPVVSAVGHEVDFSISDFVADLRAPTPSAAAELVAPDTSELLRRLEHCRARLARCAHEAVARRRDRLARLAGSHLFRNPQARLDGVRQQLDFAAERLERSVGDRLLEKRHHLSALHATLREHRPDQWLALHRQKTASHAERLARVAAERLKAHRQRLDHLGNLLRVLGPEATLARGYSITRTAEGVLVRSVQQVPQGSRVTTQLHDGTLLSEVTETKSIRSPGRRRKKT
ncbi:MAG TPA: exodeoxyribonuclease VII large subunit [Chthoniobacteraceae bacterium]|nr:exodeoxyribonuclease VII large subunit [Chthoniobacteraceae bacterium]